MEAVDGIDNTLKCLNLGPSLEHDSILKAKTSAILCIGGT